MAHLLRYEEWELNGRWYCNDQHELSCKNSVASLWSTPARMLNMELVDHVKMLIERLEVDPISYGGTEYHDAGVLVYSWNSQAKARKFKNWLNAEARKRNFIC